MKRRILLTVLTVLIFSSLFSVDFNYYVTPQAGITIGKINEYLFINQTSEKLQSDLIWEEKPLFNVGAEAGISLYNFTISTIFLYSLPNQCGNMFDSDYNSDFKTNLATYDLFNIAGIKADLKGAYNFTFLNRFSIRPSVEADYNFNSFNGTNGIAHKGDSSHSLTGTDVPYYDENAKTVRVRDINYKQHYFRLFTGIGASVILSNFTISCDFYVAPFSYVNALDIHTSSSEDSYYFMYFYSYFSDYKAQATVDYKLTDLLSIYFYTDFEWSLKKRGQGSFPFNGWVNGNKNTSFNTSIGLKISK